MNNVLKFVSFKFRSLMYEILELLKLELLASLTSLIINLLVYCSAYNPDGYKN